MLYYWAQSTHTRGAGDTITQAAPPGDTPEDRANWAAPVDPRPDCTGIAAGSGHVTSPATPPDHVGTAPEVAIVHARIERSTTRALDVGAEAYRGNRHDDRPRDSGERPQVLPPSRAGGNGPCGFAKLRLDAHRRRSSGGDG